MSAYQQQNTEMTDLDCLKEALEGEKLRSGQECKPVVHKEAQQLEGYHGDKRKQKAHIIIPRAQVGGASNDIGFEKQADGKIIAHISNFDSGHYDQKWLTKIKAKYAKIHGKKIARKAGLVYKGEKKLPNGKTRITWAVA